MSEGDRRLFHSPSAESYGAVKAEKVCERTLGEQQQPAGG